jgi:hypothetical protein
VPLTKHCDSCGRSIEYQRRWQRCWDEVRYCSAACRSRRVSPRDRQLEAQVLELLLQRGRGKTICPSEVARLRAGDDEQRWRPLIEPVRRAARRLVAAALIEICQRGRAVDPSTARGPIRLRLVAGREAQARQHINATAVNTS